MFFSDLHLDFYPFQMPFILYMLCISSCLYHQKSCIIDQGWKWTKFIIGNSQRTNKIYIKKKSWINKAIHTQTLGNTEKLMINRLRSNNLKSTIHSMFCRWGSNAKRSWYYLLSIGMVYKAARTLGNCFWDWHYQKYNFVVCARISWERAMEKLRMLFKNHWRLKDKRRNS